MNVILIYSNLCYNLLFSQGQTAFDVSDEEMKDLLDELKKKQASQNKDASDKNYLISNKLPNSQNQKRRLVIHFCCVLLLF